MWSSFTIINPLCSQSLLSHPWETWKTSQKDLWILGRVLFQIFLYDVSEHLEIKPGLTGGPGSDTTRNFILETLRPYSPPHPLHPPQPYRPEWIVGSVVLSHRDLRPWNCVWSERENFNKKTKVPHFPSNTWCLIHRYGFEFNFKTVTVRSENQCILRTTKIPVRKCGNLFRLFYFCVLNSFQHWTGPS